MKEEDKEMVLNFHEQALVLMGETEGRLAMKEEIRKDVEEIKLNWELMRQEVDPADMVDYVLEAIRNRK